MKGLFTAPIRFYQAVISSLMAPRCRYHPTCSTYTIQAIERHGVMRGGWLGVKRVCKCHPYATKHYEKTKGIDPVPEKNENKENINE
jgi:putative membrane protein insertion efficiency factor